MNLPQSRSRWTWPARVGALLAPLALFLLLATYRLDLPGLHYDEALEGGVPTVQLLAGRPMTVLNGIALHLGGRTLPLMVQNHIGALQIYAALPFVALGGPTAAAMRAMTVVGGVVTLLAVFWLALELGGRRAAFWATLWLAGFGSFVFWSRQGVFVTSLAPMFAMLALALGAAWQRTQRRWAFALAGLCMGLAIYGKLSALWILIGVVGWWLLLLALGWLGTTRRGTARAASGILAAPAAPLRSTRPALPDWRTAAAGLLGLLAGIWPILVYNQLSGWATVRTVRTSANQTYLGVNNTLIGQNLVTRIQQVADVVRSGGHLWYLGGTFGNTVALVSVLLALAALLLAGLSTDRARWRQLMFVPWLALVAILLSCFTISALWPTHFAIAVALPALIFGLGADAVYRALERRLPASRRRGGELALSALLLLVVGTQLWTSARYLRAVIDTGGRSYHAAAIYDLSRSVQQRTEHIVALDWGISTQLEYLSGGRQPVEELYGFTHEAPPDYAAQLQARFDQQTLFITHAGNQEAFPRREAFLQAVAAAGMWAERIDTIMDAEGNAMFELWIPRNPG